MSNRLYTVGYEGLDLQAFISLLHTHEVEILVDVRERPLSRKRGFSKRALSAAISAQDIAYVHYGKLGCPAVIRNDFRMDGNWQRYTCRYGIAVLDEQISLLNVLHALCRERTCALLCFEADANKCHRSLVADRLKGLSTPELKIVHICR